MKLPAAEEFWRHVKRTRGCWEWTGPKNNGYGYMPRYGLAYRLAWRLEVGEIPAGLEVCHGCDNRACVRVGHGHLFLGTRMENAMDATVKGRVGLSQKLGEPTVGEVEVRVGRVMRQRRLQLGLTLQELGRKAKPPVDAAQLSRLERGRASTVPETYRGIARALGLTLGSLFTEAEKK